MPEVRVNYNPSRVRQDYLENLAGFIGKIIAENLCCNEAILGSEDISLSFHSYGPLDRHQNDLEIFIDAFELDGRIANIEHRNREIHRRVSAITPGNIFFFVWTRLSQGAIESGQGRSRFTF